MSLNNRYFRRYFFGSLVIGEIFIGAGSFAAENFVTGSSGGSPGEESHSLGIYSPPEGTVVSGSSGGSGTASGTGGSTGVAPPAACPDLARICQNGNPAVTKGDGSCSLMCPEDNVGGPPTPVKNCPSLARICQNGNPAVTKGDGSCAYVCPEDNTKGGANNQGGRGRPAASAL